MKKIPPAGSIFNIGGHLYFLFDINNNTKRLFNNNREYRYIGWPQDKIDFNQTGYTHFIYKDGLFHFATIDHPEYIKKARIV